MTLPLWIGLGSAPGGIFRFTTFSAFSLQTFAMLRDGEGWRASRNLVASIVLCLLAVWPRHVAANAFHAARAT